MLKFCLKFEILRRYLCVQYSDIAYSVFSFKFILDFSNQLVTIHNHYFGIRNLVYYLVKPFSFCGCYGHFILSSSYKKLVRDNVKIMYEFIY